MEPVILKGLSFVLSVMFLFRPGRTKLPVCEGYGLLPLVANSSSWMCFSSSLMSTSLPSFTPLYLFLPEFWTFWKCCIFGLGTYTFDEWTIFRDVDFFLELLLLHAVVVIKGLSFDLKWDSLVFLLIEATCLVICGALLSHGVTLSTPFVFVNCASFSMFISDPVFKVLFYIPEGYSPLSSCLPIAAASSVCSLSFHRD